MILDTSNLRVFIYNMIEHVSMVDFWLCTYMKRVASPSRFHLPARLLLLLLLPVRHLHGWFNPWWSVTEQFHDGPSRLSGDRSLLCPIPRWNPTNRHFLHHGTSPQKSWRMDADCNILKHSPELYHDISRSIGSQISHPASFWCCAIHPWDIHDKCLALPIDKRPWQKRATANDIAATTLALRFWDLHTWKGHSSRFNIRMAENRWYAMVMQRHSIILVKHMNHE